MWRQTLIAPLVASVFSVGYRFSSRKVADPPPPESEYKVKKHIIWEYVELYKQ